MNSRTITGLVITLCLIGLASCQSKLEESVTPDYQGLQVLTDQTLESAILGKTVHYNILLPTGTDISTDGAFPVLYLLHGLTEDHTTWMKKTKVQQYLDLAIRTGMIPPMAVVMPEAFATFYIDDYDRFFETEFIPAVRKQYNLSSDRRHNFIMGNSMGGYGAFYHAFTYPERFRFCYSICPAADANTPKIIADYKDAHGSFEGLPDLVFIRNEDDWLCGEMDDILQNGMDAVGFPYTFRMRPGWHCTTVDQEIREAWDYIGAYYK